MLPPPYAQPSYGLELRRMRLSRGVLAASCPTSSRLASGLPARRLASCGCPLSCRLLARCLPAHRLLTSSSSLLSSSLLATRGLLSTSGSLLATRCRLSSSLAPTPATPACHPRLAYVACFVDEVEEALFSVDAGLGDPLRPWLCLTPAASSHGDARYIAPLVEIIEIPRLALDTSPSNLRCHLSSPRLFRGVSLTRTSPTNCTVYRNTAQGIQRKIRLSNVFCLKLRSGGKYVRSGSSSPGPDFAECAQAAPPSMARTRIR